MKKWGTVIAAVGVLACGACTDANQSNDPDGVAQGATCEYPSAGEPAKPVDPPESDDIMNTGSVTATMQLNDDEIVMTLDRAAAPCTVNSFVSLAEQGYFDDTACHRLTDYGIFVLQCGDPSETGRGGPGYTIPDELRDDMTYEAGVIAMANTGQPDTGGSQFFLVWADSELPPDYTVFGTMDQASIDVIAEIGAQGVDANDGTTPIAPADIVGITLG